MLPLIFIALGTLLAVTLFDVLPDAKENLSWPAFLIAAVTGYALFWLISRYLFNICPACAFGSLPDPSAHSVDEYDPTVQRARSLVWLLTAALAIHCTLDGLAVVVGDDLARGSDLAILLAVIVHKLPEGMALALYLMSAGQTPSKSLLWTSLVELTTLVGGLAGAHVLTPQSTMWLSLLFAHVGGGFLYLVVSTISSVGDSRARTNRPIVIGGGVAFTITSVLLLSLRG
jgi:ZIP family zinc transporter